jgi:hypothetical protein
MLSPGPRRAIVVLGYGIPDVPELPSEISGFIVVLKRASSARLGTQVQKLIAALIAASLCALGTPVIGAEAGGTESAPPSKADTKAKPKAEKKADPKTQAKAESKPAEKKSETPPAPSVNYPKMGPVASLLDGAAIKDYLKPTVEKYRAKKGAKALAMTENGEKMFWSNRTEGKEAVAIESATTNCQIKTKQTCHIIAINDDLAINVESIKNRTFK